MGENWLLYAIGILLTRLIYLPNDERPTARLSTLQMTAQLVLIVGLFQLNVAAAGLVALIVLVSIASWFFESPNKNLSIFRIFSLFLLLLAPLIADSLPEQLIQRPIPVVFPDSLIIAVFGLLLLANEANYLVRMLFNWCNLVPKFPPTNDDAAKIDVDEYRAGRVIGMLERALIFLIVYYTQDLSAVGFILAAKGLIRIQQLKDRQFSEYMLIGTLASVMCAVVVAFSLLGIEHAVGAMAPTPP